MDDELDIIGAGLLPPDFDLVGQMHVLVRLYHLRNFPEASLYVRVVAGKEISQDFDVVGEWNEQRLLHVSALEAGVLTHFLLVHY